MQSVTPVKTKQAGIGGFQQRLAKGPDGSRGFGKGAGRGRPVISPPLASTVMPAQMGKGKASLPNIKKALPALNTVSPQLSFAQAAMGKKSPALSDLSSQGSAAPTPPPMVLTPQHMEIDEKTIARQRAAEEAARRQRQLEAAAEQNQRAAADAQRAEQKAAAEQDKKMNARAMAAEEAARKQRQLEAAARVQDSPKPLPSPKPLQAQAQAQAQALQNDQYLDRHIEQPQKPMEQPARPPHAWGNGPTSSARPSGVQAAQPPPQQRKPAWGVPSDIPKLQHSISMPESRDSSHITEIDLKPMNPPARVNQRQGGRHKEGELAWLVGDMGTFGEQAPGVFSGLPQASEEERERARMQVEEFLRGRHHHEPLPIPDIKEPTNRKAEKGQGPEVADDTDEVFCFGKEGMEGGIGASPVYLSDEDTLKKDGCPLPSAWDAPEEWETDLQKGAGSIGKDSTGPVAWNFAPKEVSGRRQCERMDDEASGVRRNTGMSDQPLLGGDAWNHRGVQSSSAGEDMFAINQNGFGRFEGKGMAISKDFELADEDDFGNGVDKQEQENEEEVEQEQETRPDSPSNALKNMLGIGFGGDVTFAIPAARSSTKLPVWGKPDGKLDISVDPAIAQIAKALPPCSIRVAPPAAHIVAPSGSGPEQQRVQQQQQNQHMQQQEKQQMQQPQIQQQQHRAPTGDSWNRGPMNSQQPLQQHAQQHEHMQQQKDQQDQHIQQQQQQQHQHMQQQQYLLMQQQQQQQNLLQQQQQRQPHNHHPQQLILATPQSLVRQPGVDTIRELSTLQGKHCFGEIGGSSGPGAHFMQGGGLEQGSQEKGGMMGMMGEKGGMMRRMEQGDIMGNAEEVGVMGMMGSFGMPHASQMENMGGVDVLRNVFQGFPGFGGPPQELIQKMQRDNQEAFGMAMLRGMPPGMQMSGLNQDQIHNGFGMLPGMRQGPMGMMPPHTMDGGENGQDRPHGMPLWMQLPPTQQQHGLPGFQDSMISNMRRNDGQQMGGDIFSHGSGTLGMPPHGQHGTNASFEGLGMNMGRYQGSGGGQGVPGDLRQQLDQEGVGSRGGGGGFDFGKVFGGVSCGNTGSAVQMPMPGKVMSLAEIEGRQFTG